MSAVWRSASCWVIRPYSTHLGSVHCCWRTSHSAQSASSAAVKASSMGYPPRTEGGGTREAADHFLSSGADGERAVHGRLVATPWLWSSAASTREWESA